MSALSGSSQAIETPTPPRLSRLLGAVLVGEVLAAIALWVLVFLLALAGLAPFGGATRWIWLPWRIDGAWALLGAIGWGYVVCALVADAITRRGYQRPAGAWLQLAIAISGYGAMAVGHTGKAHAAVAVLAGAPLIRLIAFRLDGSARSVRLRLSRREGILAIILAALLGLSYSALHPFAADGGGGTFSGTGTANENGYLDVGLNAIHVPTRITGATLIGATGSRFTVESLALTDDGSPADHPVPRGPISYRLPAGDELWISAQVKLSSCADISALDLHYTMLGIATRETIPLQQPRLNCG